MPHFENLAETPVRSGKQAGVLLSLCASLALLAGGTVYAKPPNITQGEMALIPNYCHDTQSFNGYGDAYYNPSPRAAYWVSLMGKSFWHHHHYCYALIHMIRARDPNTNAVTRRARLLSAEGDLKYMIEFSTPDFIMLPEIYVQLGDVYAMQGNFGASMQAFQKAREIKPDYWPAYTKWADVQDTNRLRGKALATIEEGLAVMPNEVALHKAYARLGGNLEAYLKRKPPAVKAASGSKEVMTPPPSAKTEAAAAGASANNPQSAEKKTQ